MITVPNWLLANSVRHPKLFPVLKSQRLILKPSSTNLGIKEKIMTNGSSIWKNNKNPKFKIQILDPLNQHSAILWQQMINQSLMRIRQTPVKYLKSKGTYKNLFVLKKLSLLNSSRSKAKRSIKLLQKKQRKFFSKNINACFALRFSC